MNHIYNFKQFLASPTHLSGAVFLDAFQNFVNEYIMRNRVPAGKK
jgi:hypothetical protein